MIDRCGRQSKAGGSLAIRRSTRAQAQSKDRAHAPDRKSDLSHPRPSLQLRFLLSVILSSLPCDFLSDRLHVGLNESLPSESGIGGISDRKNFGSRRIVERSSSIDRKILFGSHPQSRLESVEGLLQIRGAFSGGQRLSQADLSCCVSTEIPIMLIIVRK